MSTWQVTELPKSIDVHFDVVINAVDGEDAYKKLEKVESNILSLSIPMWWHP